MAKYGCSVATMLLVRLLPASKSSGGCRGRLFAEYTYKIYEEGWMSHKHVRFLIRLLEITDSINMILVSESIINKDINLIVIVVRLLMLYINVSSSQSQF